MIAAHPLVAECAALGIVLEPDGPNGLAVEPADRLTPDLRARLVAAKGEVLVALQAGNTAAVLKPIVRGKLDAYAALLERSGYGGHPTRLPARLRRELAREAGVLNLRSIGDDAEAWRRAGLVVDGWIARLAADACRGPFT